MLHCDHSYAAPSATIQALRRLHDLLLAGMLLHAIVRTEKWSFWFELLASVPKARTIHSPSFNRRHPVEKDIQIEIHRRLSFDSIKRVTNGTTWSILFAGMKSSAGDENARRPFKQGDLAGVGRTADPAAPAHPAGKVWSNIAKGFEPDG